MAMTERGGKGWGYGHEDGEREQGVGLRPRLREGAKGGTIKAGD